MVPLPEVHLIAELGPGDISGILPVPPVRPVTSKVNAVPQLLGSQHTVRKYEVIAALRERWGIVVGILNTMTLFVLPFQTRRLSIA